MRPSSSCWLPSEFENWPPSAPPITLVARFQDQSGGERILARTPGPVPLPPGRDPAWLSSLRKIGAAPDDTRAALSESPSWAEDGSALVSATMIACTMNRIVERNALSESKVTSSHNRRSRTVGDTERGCARARTPAQLFCQFTGKLCSSHRPAASNLDEADKGAIPLRKSATMR